MGIIWWVVLIIWLIGFFVGGVAFIVWVFMKDKWAQTTSIVCGTIVVVIPVLVVISISIGLVETTNKLLGFFIP